MLRQTEQLDVDAGLTAESLAYAALQCGREFRAWQAARPGRRSPPTDPAPVLLERRDGECLSVTFNRPHRRNALSYAMRDALVQALETVVCDPSIERVTLGGVGACFCSGGDIDEFGASVDPTTAHAVRTTRSALLSPWTHRRPCSASAVIDAIRCA